MKTTQNENGTVTITLPRVYSNAEVMAALKELEDYGLYDISGDGVDVLCETCTASKMKWEDKKAMCNKCKEYSEWALYVAEQEAISMKDCEEL